MRTDLRASRRHAQATAGLRRVVLAALALAAGCSRPIVNVICDPRGPDASADLCVAGAAPDARPAGPVGVYPEGEQMPLGLYEVETEADLETTARLGWNVGQTYANTPTSVAFLRLCAEAGLGALGRLAGKNEPIPEAEAIADIQRLAQSDALLWWDLPEALRHWREGEMAIVTSYARLTRAHDPRRRPVYMYIPGHYDAAAVALYVPYLDIVPAAVYTRFQNQPHAWARFRVEETLAGIRQAKAPLGRNHLAGEKTPVAILQLFADGETVPTEAGIVHDFWQSLVSGARGVLVSSYAQRDDHPNLSAAWKRLEKAAQVLTGPEALARAILEGAAPAPAITADVISGPARTPEFTPAAADGQTAMPMSYPALDSLSRLHRGQLFVILVSSAEAPVQARLSGLPPSASSARLLLEDRDIAVTDGMAQITLPALGVQVLRLPAAAATPTPGRP